MEDKIIQIDYYGSEVGEFNGKIWAKAIFGNDYVKSFEIKYHTLVQKSPILFESLDISFPLS